MFTWSPRLLLLRSQHLSVAYLFFQLKCRYHLFSISIILLLSGTEQCSIACLLITSGLHRQILLRPPSFNTFPVSYIGRKSNFISSNIFLFHLSFFLLVCLVCKWLIFYIDLFGCLG